jgi:hypothetical protein
MKVLRKFGVGLVLLGALTGAAFSQKWTPLKHQPSFAANDALLLTDGTIMVQDTNASDWWRLIPDNTGSYVNGTWKKAASLKTGYSPLYHTAAVLPDGRLVIQGGEYNGTNNPVWTNQGAIYDPLKDKWTPLNPPAAWAQIGDAQSAVLANGTLMIGDPFDTRDAQLNAKTLKYTALGGAGKADRNDEEGWLLLPNGKVLTTDVATPHAEVFDPKTQKWSSAGSTIVRLADPSTAEIGPMVLRPDGTVFATGSASAGPAHTAIYNTKTGKWKAGPDFPQVKGKFVGIGDGPAALLPSGNVLMMASDGVFGVNALFFEWNGTKLINAPNIAGAASIPSFVGDMLVLPTGEILLTTQGSTTPQVLVYKGKGSAKAAWAPTVTSAPSTVTRGKTYVIKGTQFNGLSQGGAYGDDTQAATNYPLVRITNNATKHLFFARTHGHSTMAVATGSTPVSTSFDVPSGMETGASSLVVVANGLASKSVSVTVQ